jgi:DNA-binding CsgD family transcriptional regulator/predicted negative regulator of RcsB-dependent stress response
MHPRLSLVTMLIALGELDDAGTAAGQAAEEIRLTGDTTFEAVPPLFAARAHLGAGRLAEATAAAQDGLRIAAELGSDRLVPLALATLAQVAVQRGDPHAAAEYLDRYRREPPPTHPRFGPIASTWAAARLADADGGPAAAVAVLADLYESVPAEPALLLEEPASAAWLVRAALAAGDPDRAEQVASSAARLAAANPGFRTVAAVAAHARGLLERDAVALAGAAGRYRQPWAAASATEDAGRVFADAGDREAARGAYEQALSAYQKVGAERDVARLRARLRDLGVRHRHWARAKRPVSGWRSLTDTERRVAEVVAEGLTNIQVADRLFLSRHTVDFHLRQVFRKLGIHSRVELTRSVLESAGVGRPPAPAGG